MTDATRRTVLIALAVVGGLFVLAALATFAIQAG